MGKEKEYRKLLDKLVQMKWIKVDEFIDINAIANMFSSEHDKIERTIMLSNALEKLMDMKRFFPDEAKGFIEVVKTL